MAVLTGIELAILRNHTEKLCVKAGVSINYTKTQANSVFQTLEDHFETTPRSGQQKIWKTEIANAIEDAAPTVFNSTGKIILAATFLTFKAKKEVDAI